MLEKLAITPPRDPHVVICNAGRGRQALWPETKKPGLYSKDEADKLVAKLTPSSTVGHWHTKPLKDALNFIDKYGSADAYHAVERLVEQVYGEDDY